jgi:hypothetical protein
MAFAAVSPTGGRVAKIESGKLIAMKAPDLDDAARPRVASGKLARLLFATRYRSEG